MFCILSFILVLLCVSVINMAVLKYIFISLTTPLSSWRACIISTGGCYLHDSNYIFYSNSELLNLFGLL